MGFCSPENRHGLDSEKKIGISNSITRLMFNVSLSFVYITFQVRNSNI